MLPPEPAILLGRQCFGDAQAMMAGARTLLGFYSVGWYGASLDDERGSFAVVNEFGPLGDFVGDFLSVKANRHEVLLYVIGSRENLPDDLDMTRRSYQAISLLAQDPTIAQVSVVM